MDIKLKHLLNYQKSSSTIVPEKTIDPADSHYNFDRIAFSNFSDIKLILTNNNKIYDCHRIILSNVSPVFSKMLSSDWKESI